MRGLCSVLLCAVLVSSMSPLSVPVGEVILSQATGTEYLTFWSGDLIIVAQEPDTKVYLYDIDTGGLLSTSDPRISNPPITNPFTLSNFGDSWEERGGVGPPSQEIRLKVVTEDSTGGTDPKPVTIWTGYLNPGSPNPWMSYVPAYGETGRSGTELGHEFLAFVDEEMYIFALKDPGTPTNITLDDMVTNKDPDTDDDHTLTAASPQLDYADSEIEIHYIQGFDTDTVHVTSNVPASLLVGKRSRSNTSPHINDWSATPPSYATGDEGVERGTLFYTYVRSYLTVFPLEDNTVVSVVDLSDGDDSFNMTLDGDDSDGTYEFYTATKQSFSHGMMIEKASGPAVTIISPSNTFDMDYVKVVSNKPVLVYNGPVASNTMDYADVAYSIPTGPSSQELYCYAQNHGNSNDLQIFAYDANTNVTITSITATQNFGGGNFHDFTIGPAGVEPWMTGTDGFGYWWGSGVWSGNVLHITSDKPITVINGDYDDPQTFGAFLPYTFVGPQPPVADAGEDQMVDENQAVTLDGSGSFDPDGGDNGVFEILHVSVFRNNEVQQIVDSVDPGDLFIITQVGLTEFNSGTPPDLSGYDAIVFGINDCYEPDYEGLARISELKTYVEGGGGIVWTHDAIEYKFDYGPDAETPAGLDDVGAPWSGGDLILFPVDHEVMHSPFEVAMPGAIVPVQETHTVGGEVTTATIVAEFAAAPPATNNFYLTVNEYGEGRVSVSEIGHLVAGCDGVGFTLPSEEEARLFVNTLKWTSGIGGPTLVYEWDLDDRVDSDGDGDYTNDVDATGAVVTHTYGDNGIYNATLTVTDDDGLQDTDTIMITVMNVPPSIQIESVFAGDEGSDILFEALVTDPGSDDVTILWSWGDGTNDTETHYNDGLGPDLYPSPEINPVDLTAAQAHAYGHGGAYALTVTVTDDDSGEALATTLADIFNLPPEVVLNVATPNPVNEGDFVNFDGYFDDPSWLDTHTATWVFGDSSSGTGTFAPGSGYSHHEMYAIQHAYGDNGVYTAVLTVEDDFLASDSDQVDVTVLNVAPSPSASVSGTGFEPTTLSFDGTFADPGWLDTWEWWWDFRPDLDSDGDGISTNDKDVGGDAQTAGQLPTVQWTFNDDYEGPVYLYVLDDDGGLGVATVNVTVENVAPQLALDPVYFFNASFGLRIAGEKWHDVTIYLHEDGIEIWTATIVRYPGSPNEQMAWFENFSVNLSRSYRAEVYYTPADDPINGQVWGATPAWLIARFDDGSESRLHHTFNVRHPETWFWNMENVSDLFLGHNITFLADGMDPGSDDLTFEWDWGDSTSSSFVYYNDGATPDAYPSYWYGAYPFAAHCIATHAFSSHGTYVITITLQDDDGGTIVVTFSITI